MSKSFVLIHKHKPDLIFTLGVDDTFIRVLEILHIDVSEVSQEELEILLGIISVLKPEITIRSGILCNYVLRYM